MSQEKKYFMSRRPGLVSREVGKEYVYPSRLVFGPPLGKSML